MIFSRVQFGNIARSHTQALQKIVILSDKQYLDSRINSMSVTGIT